MSTLVAIIFYFELSFTFELPCEALLVEMFLLESLAIFPLEVWSMCCPLFYIILLLEIVNSLDSA